VIPISALSAMIVPVEIEDIRLQPYRDLDVSIIAAD